MDALPEPLGSVLTPLLNYISIPHTPLTPSKKYTLSALSDNLRASSSTCLRCHLPRGSLRHRLRYITALKDASFLLVGYRDQRVVAGLLDNTSVGMVLHVAGDVVPLGDGVFEGKHPLERYFDSVLLLYFVCKKFEEAHLILPFLYRRRQVKQLRKFVLAREKAKIERDAGDSVGKVEKKRNKEGKRKKDEKKRKKGKKGTTE